MTGSEKQDKKKTPDNLTDVLQGLTTSTNTDENCKTIASKMERIVHN